MECGCKRLLDTTYFIDVDTFYLFLKGFSTRFSNDRKERLRSQAIRVYKYTKIQGPRFQRNNIIARDQKSDLHGTSFQSSPKINRMLITRPFAYNKSLQHPTIAVLLIKIRIFFFAHSVVFTCSKVINAFKRQNS